MSVYLTLLVKAIAPKILSKLAASPAVFAALPPVNWVSDILSASLCGISSVAFALARMILYFKV
jgi:hypothetical protein